MYKLGLTLALVAPVAVFALPLADAFGLIKITVALAGVAVLWASFARFRPTGLELPLASFLAAFAWSWWFSIDPIVSLIGVTGQPFHSVAALLPAVLIFFAVAARADSWPDGAFKCASWVVAIQGVVCAAQMLGYFDEPYNTVGDARRALGTMGSPVFLGAVLAPCLPPAVWVAWRGGWGWKLASVLGFLALAACKSRGPWLAALFGLVGLLAASGAIRLPFWRLAGVGALLLALAWPQIAPRLSKSDSGRLLTWGVAVRAGAERPLTGWGPDTFALLNRQFKSPEIVREYGDGIIQASAHNAILQTWATLGLPGVLALLWLIVATWRRLWIEAVVDGVFGYDAGAAPAFGAFVALLTVSMVNPVPPAAVCLVAAMTASVLRVR